jgi:hypothetical protein
MLPQLNIFCGGYLRAKACCTVDEKSYAEGTINSNVPSLIVVYELIYFQYKQLNKL